MKKLGYLLLISITILSSNSCSLNNVKVDNGLEKYFSDNNLKGSFALLDNIHETFDIYNLKRYRDSAYIAGGSFDIFSSIIALEIGKINDQNALVSIPNDTAKTLTLNEAFQKNDSAVFSQVAASIRKDTMQYWLDSLHYGKAKIKSTDEKFWVNGSLELTPDEQLGFVEKLYFSQLPFQKRTQSMVKNMMEKEGNTFYTLSYKASWNKNPQQKYIGWISGWIEENKHVYFFVLNAEPANNIPTEGSLKNALKQILAHYGFFKGKK